MYQEALNNLTNHFPTITPKLINYIQEEPKWGLFHINPYEVALKLKISEDEVLDWMLYAVYEGLLDMTWNTICPYCGANEHQHGSLNTLDQEFYCVPCNLPLDGQLDDQVEVAFQPRAEIRELSFEPFSDRGDYDRYYYSDNFQLPQEIIEYFGGIDRGFWVIPPKQSVTFDVTIDYELYRLLSLDRHTQSFLKQSDNGVNRITLESSNSGFETSEVEVASGDVAITIKNSGDQPTAIIVQKLNQSEAYELFDAHPPTFKRFLTGKEVLNRQVFRELFPIQDLPADLSLRVGDVTLLFTDLKGSTALYEEAGDIDAYRLVKDHFTLLTEAIRSNRGALIKTIGDAVMAAFSQPEDGLRAATQMVERMSEYSQKSVHEVGLKLGLHKGAAIAVNANQSLDYFGRTVNIAARVQGEANAGEIWLSEVMMNASGIKEILQESGYHVSPQESQLRGIEERMSLYKCELLEQRQEVS
jgi:class 3 adenylate cyclase